MRRGSFSLGFRFGRMFYGKVVGGGESLEEYEEGSGTMLGVLFRVLSEVVVREWLSNILEEFLFMKYEMVEESTDVVGDCLEGFMEDFVDKYFLEGLEGLI